MEKSPGITGVHGVLPYEKSQSLADAFKNPNGEDFKKDGPAPPPAPEKEVVRSVDPRDTIAPRELVDSEGVYRRQMEQMVVQQRRQQQQQQQQQKPRQRQHGQQLRPPTAATAPPTVVASGLDSSIPPHMAPYFYIAIGIGFCVIAYAVQTRVLQRG